MDLIRPLFLIFWSFCTIFYWCETGEIITNGFDEIGEQIWQCEWYKFPDKLQRVMPTVINGIQQPVIITGFANLKLTRQSFKQVKKNSLKKILIIWYE